MPKALPLHHPTAEELHAAHAVYTNNEPTECAHRLTRHLLAEHAFTDGEAIHTLMRIWTPRAPKSTPAGIGAALEATEVARSAFVDRHITTLAPDERGTVGEIYTTFRGEVGAVGAAKALSVLNPRFFPMWDTKIAIAYLGWKWRTRRAPADHYLRFTDYAIEQCSAAVSEAAFGDTLLKTLDEWNYAIWTKDGIPKPAPP